MRFSQVHADETKPGRLSRLPGCLNGLLYDSRILVIGFTILILPLITTYL